MNIDQCGYSDEMVLMKLERVHMILESQEKILLGKCREVKLSAKHLSSVQCTKAKCSTGVFCQCSEA